MLHGAVTSHIYLRAVALATRRRGRTGLDNGAFQPMLRLPTKVSREVELDHPTRVLEGLSLKIVDRGSRFQPYTTCMPAACSQSLSRSSRSSFRVYSIHFAFSSILTVPGLTPPFRPYRLQ
jgi:hypothetical protein